MMIIDWIWIPQLSWLKSDHSANLFLILLDGFGRLIKQTGTSSDIIKLLSLLLISIPLSIPLGHLVINRRSILLHLYSIFISFYFLLYVFKLFSGTLQLVSASLFTYLSCHLFIVKPSRVPQTPFIPWSIFAALLLHLTVNHSKRIFYNVPYDTVEITGAQMVLVMKLSTFAWNVYDGQRPPHVLDPYQRSTALPQMPNLLEFLAYCFFFPSLLVGPAIPFAHYKAFADNKLFIKSAQLPRGRFKHALKNLVVAFAFAGLVGIYGSRWSYDAMLQDGFLSKTWLQRFFHVQASGLMARGKYYLVWSLSEAAFAVSGCGYDPLTTSWNAGQNINIPAIELAQNYKGIFDHWNMKTNIWLRECVYKRVPLSKVGDKPGFWATMATFAASAAWHGPLPAYFLAFLSGGIVQSLGRSIRRSIRPFFLHHSLLKFFYDVTNLILVQTNLNYLVIPFLLLDVKSSIHAWIRVGMYGHVTTVSLMLVLWLGGEKLLRDRLPSSTRSPVISQPRQVGAQKTVTAAATATVLIGENGKILHSGAGTMGEWLSQVKDKKQ